MISDHKSNPVFELCLLTLLAQHPAKALHILKPTHFRFPMHVTIATIIHAFYATPGHEKIELSSFLDKGIAFTLDHLDYDVKAEYMRTAKRLFAIDVHDKQMLLEHAKAFAIHAEYRRALAKVAGLRSASNCDAAPDAAQNVAYPSQALPMQTLGSFIRSEELPEPSSPYVIDSIIPKQGSVLLFGRTREPNSWLAAALALDAANGRKALGFFNVAEPVKVLYVQLEKTGRVSGLRLRQLYSHEGGANELGQTMMKVIPPCDLDLSDPIKLDAFRKIIEEHSPRLIIFDAFRPLLCSAEVDSERTAELLCVLDVLRDVYHCAVLLNHDSESSARLRLKTGDSSNLVAWSDVLIRVDRGHTVGTTSISRLEIHSKVSILDHKELFLRIDEEASRMVTVLEKTA